MKSIKMLAIGEDCIVKDEDTIKLLVNESDSNKARTVLNRIEGIELIKSCDHELNKSQHQFLLKIKSDDITYNDIRNKLKKSNIELL